MMYWDKISSLVQHSDLQDQDHALEIKKTDSTLQTK
jgi:hypothetical protein